MPQCTLVDANILLDIFTEDQQWFNWSSDTLASACDWGQLAINPVIYSEVSVRFSLIEELDRALPRETFLRLAVPWPAAFLAGKCFMRYRRRGGSRRSPLPDFFIGAHAAVSGMRLATRDAGRFRDYFPTLRLVAPK